MMKDRYFAFCEKCEMIKEVPTNKYEALCVDCNLNPMIVRTLKASPSCEFKIKTPQNRATNDEAPHSGIKG